MDFLTWLVKMEEFTGFLVTDLIKMLEFLDVWDRRDQDAFGEPADQHDGICIDMLEFRGFW